MSCNSSFYLHDVICTDWECLFNCLFVSMMSQVLIGVFLSINYLTPLCYGYSLIVPCQSYICLHDATGTHLEYLVNRLCVSMMSCVLIWSDLPIVFLSKLSHRCSLGVFCQSSICLHDAMVSHLESLAKTLIRLRVCAG